MTTALARRSVSADPTRNRELFAGTGWLLRLYLRLDRVQLPVWALSFFVLVWASVVAVREAYPTPESLQSRFELLHNPAAIMMSGPIFEAESYTLGAATASELTLYVFLGAAIMSVLLAVRHTRTEEESGRLEMMRALPVGRFAPASAAMITVAVANILISVAVTAGLLADGGPAADSLAFGLATGLTGLVFGAFTAVMAQLSENAATVRGWSLGAVAVAFVVRGVGDVIDSQGSWLSWFSPFAWAQQTRLYVDLRWWPLAVSAVVTATLLVFAAALAQRRDLGAGLRTTRGGRSEAARHLLSPAGLSWRLNSGRFIGWGIGLFLFSVAFGSLANSLEDMLLENPALQDWVSLNLETITRSFAALILSFLAIGPVALMVSGVLALRGEEAGNRTEGVLTSGSPRFVYVIGWVGVIALLSVVVLAVLGFGNGIGVAMVTGDTGWIGELTLASLAYVPAVLLYGAIALALFGWLPRLAPLTWVVVFWTAVVTFFGELFDLPDWARALSPLWHTPLVPEAGPEAGTLLILLAFAAVLAGVGLWGFQRRDVGRR